MYIDLTLRQRKIQLLIQTDQSTASNLCRQYKGVAVMHISNMFPPYPGIYDEFLAPWKKRPLQNLLRSI